MLNKRFLLNNGTYIVILIALITVIPYSTTVVLNTTIVWAIQMIILSVLIISGKYLFSKEDKNISKFVRWYLLWNIFSLIRGVFVAETYWDYKGLVTNTMSLLVPIIFYSATNTQFLQLFINKYLRFSLPIFFIVFGFISFGAWGFYLLPISFLVFFLPVIPTKWKIVVLSFNLLVLTASLDARSNMIKFIIPFMLLVIYYFKNYFNVKLLEIVRKALIISPLIFFYLAVSGTFNVFKMDSYIEGDYVEVKKNSEGKIEIVDLKYDTRTMLYVEVLQSINKNDVWLWGRSPARGNETTLFESLKSITGRKERLGNEVSILNILTWTGLIGVFLYFLVFYKASYLAINQSNNIFSKMIGVFTAFRWVFAWVEDINNFSLNNFFVWILIGVCFSNSFRKMTNLEIKIWVLGIFEKKYRRQEYSKSAPPKLV